MTRRRPSQLRLRLAAALRLEARALRRVDVLEREKANLSRNLAAVLRARTALLMQQE